MNKTFKVSRNKKTGKTVVVSELAKDGSAGKTVVKAASLLTAALMSYPALAEVERTGNITTQEVIAEPVVNLHDATITIAAPTGGVTFNVNNTTTSSTLKVKDVKVEIGSSAALSGGVRAGTNVGSALVEFSGTNTFDLAERNGDTAVIASSSGTGNATINITGRLDINNKGNHRSFENDGLEANTYGGGDSVVHHKGIGKIATAGGNAIHSKVTGATGNSDIVLLGSGGKNSIELVTAGGTSTLRTDGNHGISASIQNAQNTTGKINIETDAKISTSGSWANGIYALSQGGDINVASYGDIDIKGSSSAGIALVGKGAEKDSLIKGNIASKITTDGTSSHGIYAEASGLMNTELNNAETIITKGRNSQGIYVKNTGVGGVNITNTGDISTLSTTPSTETPLPGQPWSGKSSHAIVVDSSNLGSTEDVTVNVIDAKLETQAYDSSGIRVTHRGDQGNINIGLKNATINVNGINSDGIIAHQDQSGNTDINITTVDSKINLLQNPTELIDSYANFGLVATQFGEAKGNITIKNINTDIDVGLGGSGVTERSGAIYAVFSNAPAKGSITIENSGKLTSKANNWGVIKAENNGVGNTTIKNFGDISSVGVNASGIESKGTNTAFEGKIFISNSGTLMLDGNDSKGIFSSYAGSEEVAILNSGKILTKGQEGNGIRVESNSTSGKASQLAIQNDGHIETSGLNAFGIRVQTSKNQKVDVVNNGSMQMNGLTARGIYIAANNDTNVTVVNNGSIIQSDMGDGKYGIEAQGRNNSKINIYNDGLISGGQFGIVAWSGTIVHTGGESVINVGSTGKVYGRYGIAADMSKSNTINIAQGGIVDGTQAAISFRNRNTAEDQKHTLNNAGTITAGSDLAIQSSDLAANATMEINNVGTITGFMTSLSDATTVNNAGTWNLRNFADTTENKIRDKKAVAISNFGGGTDVFNNSGMLRLAKVQGESTVLTTGEYTPFGALSVTNTGTVHGQLLNLNQFNHSGVIDLTDNQQAGDVFVISGSGTAGVYVPGSANQFVSNGGVVRLDTVMNKGGAESMSDILVLDDVTLGSSATKIQVNPTGGKGGLTEGDGIKVVEVLGDSPSNAFVAAPTTYGLYEYVLSQGTGSDSKNWFLRNNIRGAKTPLLNPVVGTFLGNQYAANHMFTQNITDRRDAVRAPDSDMWMRVNYTDLDMDVIKGTQKTDIKTTMIQFGGDIAKWNDKSLGLFAGVGNSSVENTSKYSQTYGTGKVNGYHVGVYGSWIPEGDNGLYVDLWGQYAWFGNKLTGKTQNKDVKYDSSAWTVSAEVGYDLPLFESQNLAWKLKPHAQVMYSFFDSDNVIDSNKTAFGDANADGFRSRVGARFYGIGTEGVGVSPFVEANWLHDDTDNDVKILRRDTVKAENTKDIGEVKLGFEGHFNKKLSAWAHVGGQWGNKNYTRYEGQIGLGYKW